MTALRFDGGIAGLGTASGTRLVVGMWPVSPFGAMADVMAERPDGHRILVAPSEEIARFVATTYAFDEVRTEPSRFRIDGSRWSVAAGSVQVDFEVGGDLGPLRAVRPAVRFGFGSTPARPSLVRVTTTVFLPRPVVSGS